MKFGPILLALSFVYLVACTTESSRYSDDFPYGYIHKDFQYHPFKVPEQWDVVSVHSDVKLQYRDNEEPKNHAFSDIPYGYTFMFGREAPENSVSDEDLISYNEQHMFTAETNRQHYYHTYHQQYAKLQININGFMRLISQIDDTEEWDIHGETFLVLRKENEWAINWYNGGIYYDVLIRNEAGIDNVEQLQEFIAQLFF